MITSTVNIENIIVIFLFGGKSQNSIFWLKLALFYNISGIDTTYRLPNYLKLGADLLFKYRGFSLLAEYVNTKAFVADDITHRNDRYGDDPTQITSSFGAWYENDFTSVSSNEYVKRLEGKCRKCVGV